MCEVKGVKYRELRVGRRYDNNKSRLGIYRQDSLQWRGNYV